MSCFLPEFGAAPIKIGFVARYRFILDGKWLYIRDFERAGKPIKVYNDPLNALSDAKQTLVDHLNPRADASPSILKLAQAIENLTAGHSSARTKTITVEIRRGRHVKR
jgi:hypothetical protein